LICFSYHLFPKQHEDDIMAEQHRGGSGNFAQDREKASDAGRKGGQHSGGNFKNDPQRASEAGRKGGENSYGGGRKTEK
jgi:general stress protein YciG